MVLTTLYYFQDSIIDENNTEILLNFNKVSTKATIGVLENTTLPIVY